MRIDAHARQHGLTVVCAACRGPALAEFVLVCEVRSAGAGLFADLPAITLRRLPAPRDGFEACYRPTPGAPDLRDIAVPEAYAPGRARWSPRASDAVVTCLRCGVVQTRAASQKDYFFQVDYRGKALRAGSRGQAQDLLAFIEDDDRRRKPWKDYRYGQGALFLSRIPTAFLTAKARDTIVQRLRKRIAEGTA